jgi:hypothetical protein
MPHVNKPFLMFNRWVSEDDLESAALPTVMRKALLVYTEGVKVKSSKKKAVKIGDMDAVGRKQTGISQFFVSKPAK